MSWDVAGQPGQERKASGRCEVPRGIAGRHGMLHDVA